MEKSESIKSLAAALVKLQGEIGNPKNTADNPFFHSRYTPLNDVISFTKPYLAKHGLAVTQIPHGENLIGITTVLMHESGEWISDSMTMSLNGEKGKSVAQEAGSVITYLRRYSLASVLGIASEDDDDGNMGAKNHPSQAKKPDPEQATLRREIEDMLISGENIIKEDVAEWTRKHLGAPTEKLKDIKARLVRHIQEVQDGAA